MALIGLMIKNGLRTDKRKFVPFIFTIAVAILMISFVAAFKSYFSAIVKDSICRINGGDVVIIKSAQAPEFRLAANGVYSRWSKQLFTRSDVSELFSQYPCSPALNLPGYARIGGTRLQIQVNSRADSDDKLQMNRADGTIPSLVMRERTEAGDGDVIPVAVTFARDDLKVAVGDRFDVFFPSIVASGGSPNIIGVYEYLPGLDYLDWQNGRWATVEVVGLVDEQWAYYDNAIYLHLDDLQAVTGGHQYINSAAVRTSTDSMAALAAKVGDLQARMASGYHAFSVVDQCGLTGEVTALEQHAGRLLQMVALISLLMVANVLIIILAHRRQQDAQLLFLGIKRHVLLTSLAAQVALISASAVAIGLVVPVAASAFATGGRGLRSLELAQLFWIIPLSSLVAAAIAAARLPGKRDTLEVMRNE